MSWHKGFLVFSAMTILVAAMSEARLPAAGVNDPVVLGEWHTSYAKTKQLADDTGIPMLVVWGDSGCHFCDNLDLQMGCNNFINYRQNRKLVMLYVKDDGDNNATKVHTWAKNSSGLFPYVLIYWKGHWLSSNSDESEVRRFTARFSPVVPASAENGQAFINKVESYISTYVTPPNTPPAVDAFDTADDSEAGATRLAMSKVAKTSTPHYLNQSDTADWYRFTNLVADTEYRVWASDFTQSGASNLTATFYLGTSATTLTNMPLASLTTAFAFNATDTDNLLLKISRSANTNATVSYTLNYREWVPCTLSLATNAVSVSGSAAELLVVARRSGDAAATSATLSFSNGTATAGADYVATPVTLTWTAGGSDVRTGRVALVTDKVWEGNETFFIHMTPNPATASGGLYLDQSVTIIENTAPTPGKIGYTSYGPAGNKTALLSSTKISVHEGDPLVLWLARTLGTSLPASAVFTWSDGSPAPAPLSWASLESGEKEKDVIIPEQPGYQPARTLYLDFTATGAAATLGKTRATLTVSDAAYVSSLVAYTSLHPAIPFKTTADAWFLTQGDALRCAPPAAAGTSVMTAALTGPGVLVFKGAKSDSGVFTLKVGSRSAQNVATDGSDTVVVLPAGVQTVTWSFARDGGSTDQSFASITGPSYVKLPAVTPIAPVAGSVVRTGPLALRWSDAFADVKGISGVVWSNRVYTGASSSTVTTLVGSGPDTSVTLPASVGTLFWRVDLTLGDGTNLIVVKGTVNSTTVVPLAAPAFDVTEGDVQDQTWFDSLTDATLKVKMVAGVHVMIGPLPVDVGAGTVSAKVKTGTLPTGLSLAVEGGAVWVKGVPTKAGTGTVLIQVSSKVGAVTTAGTTLALVYTIEALPAGAYGTFNGDALYGDSTTTNNGIASMTVVNTGRTSGKFQFAGKSYAFSADGFDYVDGTTYWITNTVATIAGTTTRVALVIGVGTAFPGLVSVGPFVDGQLPQIAGDMNLNAWAASPLDAPRQAVIAACQGYYTAVLPDADPLDADEFGSGYLTLTVAANGSVKATGKLADGTAASMSGTLLLDADGKPYTVLFQAPTGYLGGYIFVRIDFDASADPVALSGAAVWRSKSLQATGVYGAGFDRLTGVQGGLYDKTLTLDELYAPTTTFEVMISKWESWPAAELPSLGLNALGTGFTVVSAGGPDDSPVSLTLTANKATGLFSGSFHDYDGLTYATRTFFGALTPTLIGDTLAGRGFYLEPLQHTAPVYNYNVSHSLDILGCDGCAE